VFTILAIASVAPIVLVTQLPQTPLIPALAATTLFMVCVSGRAVPAVAMVSSVVEPRRRGSFMSLVGAVQQLAATGATSLAGFIVTEGPDGRLLHYDYVGYLAALITVVMLAVRFRPAPVG